MSEATRLVIFDCDGVLVDSERIAVRVDLGVLAEFGLLLSEAEVIERFVGRSPEVMAAAIEAHLGQSLPEHWEEPFEPLYADAFERELAAVDGIYAALDDIPYLSCVASSSDPPSLRRKLELAGLYDRFEGRIFSTTEVANGKPAPDLFLHAAQRMGAAPKNCVVVEDSPVRSSSGPGGGYGGDGLHWGRAYARAPASRATDDRLRAYEGVACALARAIEVAAATHTRTLPV